MAVTMSHDTTTPSPPLSSSPSPPNDPSASSAPSTSALPDSMSSANGSTDRLSLREQTSSSTSSSLQQQLQMVTAEPIEDLNDGEREQDTGSSSASELESGAELEVLIEALKSKDRLFVLKLGEQMEALIKERGSRTKIESTPQSAYQKMLVYRCATYYKLTPKTQPSSQTISLFVGMDSKIPSRRISELVPPEETAHPAFKIMRRSEQDRKRSKASFSQPGSVAGEDGELSDMDPSETGSMGSRSTTSKKRMTIEEREARYQEARSRIFNKSSKERDASASSSTLSLASGNASTNGGGSSGGGVDDLDDSASNAPVDSDWTGSVTSDRRRTAVPPHMSSSSSTARGPYRSSSSPYDGHAMNGQSSSSSPAVTYPSIYDPASGGPAYDAYMQPPPPPPSGYVMPYPMYPYPPVPGQPYVTPYPYYGFHQPHYTHQPSSDPASPVSSPVDTYPNPPPGQHANPYMWQYAPPPPLPTNSGHPPPMQHGQGGEVYSPVAHRGHPVPHPVPGQGHSHSVPPTQPHQQVPPQPYHPYGPGIPYGPIPGPQYAPYNTPTAPYYSPQGMPPQQQYSQPAYHAEHPPPSGSVSEPSTSSSSGGHSPTYSRNGHGAYFPAGNNNNNHNNNGNNGRRGAPAARAAWSYGPGPGVGGMSHPAASGSGSSYGQGMGGASVGPRLGGMNRKTSGGSGGGGSGNRTPADDASTASSSASSSSSRRTYMSNSTPPKHPLPARPDWAAGMKAQPTLATPTRRPHNDSNNSSRNMSPAKPPLHLGQPHQQLPTPSSSVLQPNDFPPLSMSSMSTEKRTPVGGAWSSNQTRTILASHPGPVNQAQGGGYGTALFNHSAVNGVHNPTMMSPPPHGRLDDDEKGFERPPPKINAELFNPKGGNVKRSGSNGSGSGQGEKEKERELELERARSDGVANAILVDKLSSMKVQDRQGSRSPSSSVKGEEREQSQVDGAGASVPDPSSTAPQTSSGLVDGVANDSPSSPPS